MKSILLYLNEGKVKDHFKKYGPVYAASALIPALTVGGMYGFNKKMNEIEKEKNTQKAISDAEIATKAKKDATQRETEKLKSEADRLLKSGKEGLGI